MKDVAEYVLFLLLRSIARRMSYRTAGVLGGGLGAMTYDFVGFRRRLTLDNLRHALPDLSENRRTAIARKAFRNYGIALLQMLWASGQSEKTLLKTVKIADPSTVENNLGKGKGVILLSGHYGGWELIIHGLRLHLGKPMTVIVQRQRNRRIDRIIDEGRRRHGNDTITMGPSSRQALTTLQNNGIVAMLGDQSGPKESVFVEFFGRPAATHRGAAAFSLRTGAPIVMTFLVRQLDGSYTALFEEVDRTGLDEYSDTNIIELTRRHTAILEKHIRAHPDHWLWMHKRWKHTQYFAAHEALTESV